MVNDMLPPNSAFSKAVFKVIRQHIPRSQWPNEPFRGTFVPSADGLSLYATFDGLSPPYAGVATKAVYDAKVDLVLASPLAYQAAAMVKMRRWRDTFLYALVPLLFAIPLMAPLADLAMRLSIFLFVVDLAALLGTHASVLRWRSELAQGRFIAQIPPPGYKMKVSAGTPLAEHDED
ncbi:conserved hypothetical protein [Candidatus Terasakiella magnetica]|nr:conserved hypothetical protein [Candidatus Terasakiella magnetica]